MSLEFLRTGKDRTGQDMTTKEFLHGPITHTTKELLRISDEMQDIFAKNNLNRREALTIFLWAILALEEYDRQDKVSQNN